MDIRRRIKVFWCSPESDHGTGFVMINSWLGARSSPPVSIYINIVACFSWRGIELSIARLCLLLAFVSLCRASGVWSGKKGTRSSSISDNNARAFISLFAIVSASTWMLCAVKSPIKTLSRAQGESQRCEKKLPKPAPRGPDSRTSLIHNKHNNNFETCSQFVVFYDRANETRVSPWCSMFCSTDGNRRRKGKVRTSRELRQTWIYDLCVAGCTWAPQLLFMLRLAPS